jgi:hypothetical protein
MFVKVTFTGPQHSTNTTFSHSLNVTLAIHGDAIQSSLVAHEIRY